MTDFQKQLRAKVYSLNFPKHLHTELLLILDEEDSVQVAEKLLELYRDKLNNTEEGTCRCKCGNTLCVGVL